MLPDRGLGRFSLTANQTLPLNAFVELDLLGRRLERADEVNAVLLASTAEGPGEDAAAERLQEALDAISAKCAELLHDLYIAGRPTDHVRRNLGLRTVQAVY